MSTRTAAPVRCIRHAAAALACLLLGACAVSPNPAAERIAHWNADLDVVRDRFLVLDRSYPPAARRAAAARVEALRARLPGLDDRAVTAELARVAALSGNAHTRAYVLRNRGLWRRYPIRIWRFADGWRVVAAQGVASPLVGSRVLAIGGLPVDAVAAGLRPLFAGNDSWAEYMASYTLTSPDALAEAIVVDASGAAAFTVERDGRVTAVDLEPLPFVHRDGPEESWWFLSPAQLATRGWSHVLAGRSLPPLLDGAAADYRFVRCAGDVLYVQFNRAADAPGQETVAAWGERLLAALRDQPPRRLLLDLRFNTGGDLTKAQPLIEAIARLPLAREPGALMLLSGTSTFSAGLTPLAWLRSHAAARIVGRHPGDDAVFWAEGGNVVLPHSRLPMHYADGLHVYADRTPATDGPAYLAFDVGVRDLEPDLAVAWAWDDYQAGRDPVAEAALGHPLACPS